MSLTTTAPQPTPTEPAPLPTDERRTCRNPHCGGQPEPEPDIDGTTYCIACADLADDHDHGAHDHDSNEFCPACQP